MTSGWNTQLITRRRMMAATAASGVGLAGLGLVGCGDDDKGAGPAASTVVTSGTPKKGGIINLAYGTDPPTLDPYANTSGYVSVISSFVHSRLMKLDRGPGGKEGRKIVGDLALSWEQPDNSTIVVKLNPKAKFHAPVSRQVTAEDVKFSLDRYLGLIPGSTPSPKSGYISNIDSITVRDPQTVVLKAKRPQATFILTFVLGGGLVIIPKETGTAYNPSQQMVGSGPWILSEFRPGVGITYKRNPEWHLGPDAPYADGINQAIIKDVTLTTNQFLAGNLDALGGSTGGLATPPSDLPRVKQGMPELYLGNHPNAGFSFFAMSLQTPGAPWADARVRQAISMAMDRDAIGERFTDSKKLNAAGIPLEIHWLGSAVPLAFPDYRLNPKTDPKISKYYKYDVAEAKKLMSAAGYPNGFNVDYYPYIQPADKDLAELVRQYLGAIGVNIKIIEQDYAAFAAGALAGKFTGFTVTPIAGAAADAGDFIELTHVAGSGTNRGQINDPELERRIAAFQTDFNIASRKQKILDVQPYLAEKMYYTSTYAVNGFLLMNGKQLGNIEGYHNDMDVYGTGTDQFPYFSKK